MVCVRARCGSACGDYKNPAIWNSFDVTLGRVQRQCKQTRAGRKRELEDLYSGVNQLRWVLNGGSRYRCWCGAG